MKRVGVCILLLFVVITAVQLLDQDSLHDSENKIYVPGRRSNDMIEDVFLTEDKVYCVTEKGDFYFLDEFNRYVLLEQLCEGSVCWNDKYEKSLYLSGGGYISCFDPKTGEKEDLISLFDSGIVTSASDYMICTWGNFAYCKIGEEVYKVHLSNGDIQKSSPLIKNMISVEEKGIICQSDDYKTIAIFDPLSDETRILFSEETNEPIVTACIIDDILFFARADGKIKQCRTMENVNDSLYNANTMSEKLSGKFIYGIATAEEGLLCITGERNNDDFVTTVFLALPNGTIETLMETKEINYYEPGSCIVKANEKMFAFGVTTDKLLIMGAIAA